MQPNWIEIILLFGTLAVCSPFLGSYIARVYAGEATLLSPILRPVEKIALRLLGQQPGDEQTWQEYTLSVLVFHLLGFILLVGILLAQGILPLNPAGLPGVEWTLAVNTATSFVTNTNWQAYAGETSLSHFSQMAGLTVQNFVSASAGMAVLAAVARGILRRSASTLGNFWVDLVRGVVYILLPVSLIMALVLVSQGVVQNFSGPVQSAGLHGSAQALPQGPAAGQIAIKQLGTNGGGFFNTNSAHPYENPTPLSNFVQLLSILLIPAALTIAYGKMVADVRQGWAILVAMSVVFVAIFGLMLASELAPNPALGGLVSLEGKEVRFGVTSSVLWGAATTAASNGSVNAMISSFTPLAGGLAMLNIMLGEVIFGGVGSGLYGMLLFVILTAFIAGLMVGRTPEYLGKKIEAREVQMTIIAILLPSACILLFGGLAAVIPAGISSRLSAGPHGLSEILYAFTSASGNNGSAFGGLNANTPFYNLMLALAMWVGRLGVMAPVLVIAGSLARKKYTPPSVGTLPTHSVLFITLLIGILLIVGALTFFPALALGPLVEHLLMAAGRVY